ncbi:15484_t:CDS:1, partial [Funneliformis caledonium]
NAQNKKSNAENSTAKKYRCVSSSKKKSKKVITISDSEDNCDDDENGKENNPTNLNFNELEYQKKN